MEKGYHASLEIMFDKLQNLISTRSIVGEPLIVGDVTILPIIEVSMGIGAGGKAEGTGMGGMGAKIIPSSILVIQKGDVKLINVKNQDAVNRIIDMVPEAATKLGFAFGSFGKGKSSDNAGDDVVFEEKTVVE